MPGGDNLIVEARTALLDAVLALEAHINSVILIGAQAVYLHTGKATFALVETTKDSDLAIDPRTLGEDPRLEEAMTKAGFILNPVSKQPGAWLSIAGGHRHRGPRSDPSAASGRRDRRGGHRPSTDSSRTVVRTGGGARRHDGGACREGIGQPDTVSRSVSFLAQDLLGAVG